MTCIRIIQAVIFLIKSAYCYAKERLQLVLFVRINGKIYKMYMNKALRIYQKVKNVKFLLTP